jgi:hypothetical protein
MSREDFWVQIRQFATTFSPSRRQRPANAKECRQCSCGPSRERNCRGRRWIESITEAIGNRIGLVDRGVDVRVYEVAVQG